MNGSVQQGLVFNPIYEDIMQAYTRTSHFREAATCKSNKSQCTQCLKTNHSSVDLNFLGIVAEISRVAYGI